MVDETKQIDNCTLLKQAFDFIEEIAPKIIKDDPENQSFIINPDDPNEHKPEWHQFGIITHTKWVLFHYENTMQKYLKKWGVDKNVDTYLDAKIDGMSRKRLLGLSIPFHDVGKFLGRYFKVRDGQKVPYYNDHEKLSEKLINENDDFQLFFKALGLTFLQIDYIAKCAGLHYELGKIRDIIRSKRQSLFNIAFTKSQSCKDFCVDCMVKNPIFTVEIGVLYLCDSLAKTDIILDVETDEEVLSKSNEVDEIVTRRVLHPNLVNTIKQLPANIALARTYMELIPY